MLLLVFLPHRITHTVKTVSFFMILYLMSAIVKSNHSACSQLHKGQVFIMHVWFRSIYLQCKLSMPISLCVYNQNIFFGQFMQLWHEYKNLLFESVLYMYFTLYIICFKYMHYYLNWDLWDTSLLLAWDWHMNYF